MTPFLELHDIENLQIDHTTSCNLLCTQCSRVVNGKKNPNLPSADLTADDYKKLFAQFSHPIKTLLFCGNYGDVAASSTFIESLKTIKSLTSAKITLMTNGSLRTPEWWMGLARILDPERDKVCWSIDGLSDTNSIYRVNSDFSKIMENAKSFIATGGRARWDFIAFKHNEHQIEEAQDLARRMGFYMFSLKRTSRFINDTHFRENTTHTSETTTLDVPRHEHLVSEGHKAFDQILKSHASWDDYVRTTPIDCKFKKSKTLFIDFKMQVWPCTWTAAPVYYADDHNTQKKQLFDVLARFPKDFNSLHHHSLNSILSSEWYNSLLVESWDQNHSARLTTCGRTCGQKYNYSASTQNNRDFIALTKEVNHVL